LFVPNEDVAEVVGTQNSVVYMNVLVAGHASEGINPLSL
jgi:hypothetical protein